MKDLSVIISAEDVKAKEYVKNLEPVLKKMSSELIIVNNEESKINIPYDCIKLEYKEDYSGFIRFCMGSTVGKKVLIIEDGMVIDKDIVKAIELYALSGDCQNISCDFIDYFDSNHLTYSKNERVLVYTRGVKGFNQKIDNKILNYSFIKDDMDSVKRNIQKLIYEKRYCELYKWYRCFILQKQNDIIKNFKLELEKEKSVLDNYESKNIDEIFKSDNTDKKYVSYLSLKEKYINTIPKITEDDLYYSWLLKKKENIIPFLKNLSADLQEKLLIYILKNDDEFEDSLYEFIIDSKEKMDNGIDIQVYSEIMKAFLDFMTYAPETKQRYIRIIEILDLYVKYAGEFTEKEFISEYKDAVKLLDDGKIEDAAQDLKLLCIKYPKRSKILRLCISKIRYDHKFYNFILSVCMIVRDERKNIDRCLKSLKPLVDQKLAEIIVVDTGSKDDTLKKAQKYTDKVYANPWQNDFSRARNFSISLAEGEYIFILDADEEFSEKDVEKLIEEFKDKENSKYNTFTLRLVNYTDIEHKQFAVLTQPRIFKNTGLFMYSSSVHNQPVLNTPIKNPNIELLHYGYIMTKDIKLKKFIRTSTLLKKELQKDPDNIYYRFQLSSSYGMFGNLKSALRQVEIYMRDIKELALDRDIILMYYNNAAVTYMDSLRFDEAEKICDDVFKANDEFIDFVYYKAEILFYKKKYEESIKFMNRYFFLINDYFKLDIANDGRYSFYTLYSKDEMLKLYIKANHRIKNYENVLEKVYDLKDETIIKNTLKEIVDSYFNVEKFDEMYEFYKKRIIGSKDKGIKEVFDYFVYYNILNVSREKGNIYKDKLKKSGFKIDENKNEIKTSEAKSLIENYDINSLDFNGSINLIYKFIDRYKNFKITARKPNMKEILIMIKFGEFILNKTSDLIKNGIFEPDEIMDIFDSYMMLASYVVNAGEVKLLNGNQGIFIGKLLKAIEELKKQNYDKSLEIVKEAKYSNFDTMEFAEFVYKIISDEKDAFYESQGNKTEYIKELKEKLAVLKEPFDVIAEFDKYDDTSSYDAQLYSLKANSLLYLRRIEEAEKLINEGYCKFGNDIHILKSMYNLKKLENDYKGKVKILSKMCLNYPQTDISEYKFVPLKENEIKVLQGTMDLSDRTLEISKDLNERGIFSKTFNYIPRYSHFKENYVMDLSTIEAGNIIVNRSVEAASKLISEFDIFHFHCGMTLDFMNNDLKIIKDTGKKALMHFWDTEVQLKSISCRFNPYTEVDEESDNQIKKKLEKLSDSIDFCIVGNEEVREYVKEYFKNVFVINQAVDLKKYSLKNAIHDDTLKIAYAPSFGDNYCKKVIDILNRFKEKYNIKFMNLTGLLRDEKIDAIRRSDLVIDEISTGFYGESSLDAMAFNKPVMAYIDQFMEDKYPKDIPIINVNPDNLEKKIEYVIKNKNMLSDIGTKGRNYVQKYHNKDTEINKIINIYKEMLNE